ncbi:hypothetical protein, partial [Halorubrum aquaticum]|uniref:hypothetical protein n=1 Tax=Halorubrum aquaticum TaxID=387340 RepID=UPI001CB6C92E
QYRLTAVARLRAAGGREEPARESVAAGDRRGWGGVRCGAVRGGVGFKGTTARTTAADARTARNERSE